MNSFLAFLPSATGKYLVTAILALVVGSWSGCSLGKKSGAHEAQVQAEIEQAALAASCDSSAALLQARVDSLKYVIEILRAPARPKPATYYPASYHPPPKQGGGVSGALWAGVGLVTGLVIGHNLGDEAHAVCNTVVNVVAPKNSGKKPEHRKHGKGKR